ncbi:hypothetical protein GCM10023115_01730 [Pontixanthobacter gangjinensis]|uniref:DUF305 domain-containing protein n=1 Tax=Pontixanthobacter gangjinensis TaxID=1028742 RepID=A0A6I4SJ43_9SPHN|nr:DUF305 domain-containing protein [Pontixanthobacter gangjinensis]MXO55428.1 DUF305 domain-containing protein [Pontixanthobacter gangjinensis]
MLAKSRLFATVATAAILVSAPTLAQTAPIVQPGAVGQPVKVLTADEATALASASYAPADAMFMQGMIVHHQQAVDMAALVGERTNKEEILAVAGRINSSQADEIKFMTDWLTEKGEPLKMDGMGHASHMGMMGMATPAQMEQLAASRGTNFDRLFLELMVRHHTGAIDMVDDLIGQPGTASDPVFLEFTDEVKNDQNAEIERMNAVLASLSDDPRATLTAGLTNAGEAISNLRKVASLPKPTGFFDPTNPAELRPIVAAKDDDEKSELGKVVAAVAVIADALKVGEPDKPKKPEFAKRGPLLDFANTDMAFSGDILVAGSYHGFNAYRLGDDGMPNLLSSVVCPGGQGDVSIIGDLLIMSVQDTRARKDCGLQGVPETISDERFRGLRIFDVSDWANPLQVGQVQTCRGSHTHSVVSQSDDALIVYNSGTSRIRDEKELAGCIGDVPGDDRTALFRIDVIEIPLADPSKSRIVDSPAVFADPATGRLAGLWQGGDHGDETQETNSTNHCHDITVFPSLKLAAGACSGNGIIFDISDPLAPKRIDEVTDKGFAYWHSATFNNDGTKVMFTDEWGGGVRPRCQATDPRNWGANAIYEIVDQKLEFRSLYKLPAPQGDKENCVAHNGSIIPVPGRDIFVQAWYQGGISVIDFTDATNPFEIAYFDRGPIDKDQLVTGGYWSAYWYKGRIYGTEITRGLDVFALEPSEFLSAEEIAAAESANQGDTFNPQTQFPVTWSAEIVSKVENSRKGG